MVSIMYNVYSVYRKWAKTYKNIQLVWIWWTLLTVRSELFWLTRTLSLAGNVFQIPQCFEHGCITSRRGHSVPSWRPFFLVKAAHWAHIAHMQLRLSLTELAYCPHTWMARKQYVDAAFHDFLFGHEWPNYNYIKCNYWMHVTVVFLRCFTAASLVCFVWGKVFLGQSTFTWCPISMSKSLHKPCAVPQGLS